MGILSSERIKQYLFLIIIIALTITLGWQLRDYIPGMLGALTLYVLMRRWYFKLVIDKGWKKWLTAFLFLLIAAIVFIGPVLFMLHLLIPKLSGLINNPDKLNHSVDRITHAIQRYMPGFMDGKQQIQDIMKNSTMSLIKLLGASVNTSINAILAFFLLYFMLINGKVMEKHILNFLPLKRRNIHSIWEATRVMVLSNAIGIPILAAAQAITASIGYMFFGLQNPILWGIITGMCSLVPVVGTALVWIPVSFIFFAHGKTLMGAGVLLYGIAVIVNLDHVLRFTLLKKIGNVHPIVTVLGIIIGLPLFGIMGFIFGPLLISYLLLLIKVYNVEFSTEATIVTQAGTPADEIGPE